MTDSGDSGDSGGRDRENAGRIYAVRFSPHAEQELARAAIRLIELTGSKEFAAEWYGGVKAAVATLAEFPARLQTQAKESRLLGREVRRLLYQRSAGSSAPYHLYFTVEDDGKDGPVVRILHVRHAARKPVTRKEAEGIRKGDP
jgi:plasmid stabilization system protein ParE